MAVRDLRPIEPIIFYFDFLSPFAYLANIRLQELAPVHGRKVIHRAVDLGQLKSAIGNTGPGNRDLPVKLAYIKKDLERWADRYSVPLSFPPNYSVRSLNCGLYFSGCTGCEEEYVTFAFDQTWAMGKAPDDMGVLVSIADHMGWNGSELVDFVHSAAAEAMLQQATSEAIEKGVFGVPTVGVGSELWWGNDRLQFLEETLIKEQ